MTYNLSQLFSRRACPPCPTAQLPHAPRHGEPARRLNGMIPLATPFSLADVDTIAELDLPAIKIASPDVVNRPLLLRAAELQKPVLVSTGAATMDEVDQAAVWLRDYGASFALLHCVSS